MSIPFYALTSEVMGRQSGAADDPITFDSDDESLLSSTYSAALQHSIDLTSSPSPRQSTFPGSYTASLRSYLKKESTQSSRQSTVPEANSSKTPSTPVFAGSANYDFGNQPDPQVVDYELQSQISSDISNSQRGFKKPNAHPEYDDSTQILHELHSRRDVSPRAQMAAAVGRASMEKDETHPDPTKSDFEGRLKAIQMSLKCQHASSVQSLLCDARSLPNKKAIPIGDSISPFSGMGALNGHDPTAIVTNEISLSNRQDSAARISQLSLLAPVLQISQKFPEKKKVTSTIGRLIQIKPDVESVPQYEYYTHITRSVYRPDDERLHFEPWLGDADLGNPVEREEMDEFRKKFMKGFDKKEDPMASRGLERAVRLYNSLNDMLRGSGLTHNHLYQGILDHVTASDKYGSPFMNRHKNNLQKALAKIHIKMSHGLLKSFTEAFKSTFELDLSSLLLEHDTKLHELMDPETDSSSFVDGNIIKPSENLSTYTDLVCMICHTSVCPTHRRWDPKEAEFDYQTRSYDASVARRDALLAGDKIQSVYQDDSYCSLECYLKNDHMDQQAPEWSSADSTLLETFLSGMPLEPRPACIISMAMPRQPCWAVQRQVSNVRKEAPPLLQTIRSRRLDWFDPARKKLSNNWEEKTNTHKHEFRDTVSGCQHEGPCSDKMGCTCVAENVLCEKLCACTNCARKFTGCACREQSKACSDARCICQQLNRECDPDLCGSCGAVERADPQCRREKEFFKSGCQNVELQISHRIARKTVIGRTKIIKQDYSGTPAPYDFFGLYAGEDIPAGAFIDEYVGEIISVDESNRWAELLKKTGKNYGFTLNNCEVIDSQRKGNHTRFINHADPHPANTTAKVVLVNLVHRIKFRALKDIPAGCELFFDYGEDFVTTQPEMPRKKTKVSTEKATRKRVYAPLRPDEDAVDEDFDVHLGGLGDGIDEVEVRKTKRGRTIKVQRYTR